MPVNVPSDPKIYTTKYANLRGVDYTNDPSNVWYRRSPNGLNMLPNLDGQPFKRNGWKIELTEQDFIVASGLVGVTSVEQYKVDYFELGGAEFLWFYTSIGCFYYADELVFVDSSYEIGDDAPYEFSKSLTYDVGDYCMCNGTMYKCKEAIETPTSTLPSSDITHWTPTEVKDGETVPVDGSKAFPPADGEIDYTKAFFFEGGGRAGYYLFASNRMYMFDGAKLHECKPTIPVVLTMADSNGVGTLLYDVNMLTEWRAIEYECNGEDEFKVPDGFINDSTTGYGGILNAYTLNADGSVTPNYNWSIVNAGALKFNPAPTSTRPNQPSLRIVYKSANSSVSEEQVTSSAVNLKVTLTVVKTTKQTRTKKTSAWVNGTTTTKTTYANTATASVTITNPKKPIVIEKNIKNGSWGNTNDTSITASVNSYGTSVTLSGANNGKTVYDKCGNISPSTTSSTKYSNVKTLSRTRTVTTKSVKTIPVRIKYQRWKYTASQAKTNEGRNAFFGTSRVLVHGNGIINQAFLTASSAEKYNTRVWYSMATDPLFFPDTNYIEVGATDKKIMGMIKVGDYLGIIKQGSATDTSIYLAYATSFEDITTYAVKQSVNGIGAISNGAFNILNDEPLFLSAEGVMGIEPAEDEARKIRNRSYYINKPLLEEPSLESAVSFVFEGMYWLAVNNHCYVLDGSQKNSWENTKTNLQYEAYYLDNMPAKCFAKKDGRLWFIDRIGNVCRFRDSTDDLRYVDAYDAEALSDENAVLYKTTAEPVDGVVQFDDIYNLESERWFDTCEPITAEDTLDDWYTNGASIKVESLFYENYEVASVEEVQMYFTLVGEQYVKSIDRVAYGASVEKRNGEYFATFVAGNEAFLPLDPQEEHPADTHVAQFLMVIEFHAYVPIGSIPDGAIVKSATDGTKYYTVTGSESQKATVVEGVPIKAVWSTIADDDGSAHYYKKLQKKGSLVALMPMSDSGVKVWLVVDGKPEEEWIFVGETDAKQTTLPFNYYLKKKVKRYKHLQIICENATYNDGFGIDEIIKCYTIGNYAKR